MRTMVALTRAPVCAGVRVAAPRKAARKANVGGQKPQLQLLSRSLQLCAARKPSSVVAAAGDDGYASSDDPEVTSGKRKAVSSMNVKDLQAELTAAGLDTAGNKAELSSRVKTLRSGKPLPAASEFAAMASTPAPKSSDSGDAAKTIARLEEELTLARQMTQAAVTRAEKAEAALAAAGGQQAPAAGGGGGSTSPAILKLHVKVAFGDTVLLCGSHASLGAWDVAGAATLSWTEGDVWQAQVALPQEGRLEMKFLVRTADGGLVWQAGSNLAVEVPKGAPGGDAVPAERSFNFAGTWAVGSSRASLTAEGPMAEADIPKPKKEEPPAPAPEPAPPAAEAAAPEPTPPAPEPEAAPAAAEAPAAEAPAAEAPAAEAAEPTA